MAFWKRVFTWWDGVTIGTALDLRRNGVEAGSDYLGNTYYLSKKGSRRMVAYVGEPDPALLPPEWYGWLHHMLDQPPEQVTRRPWQKVGKANTTGTPNAYKPAGSLDRGGQRPHATSDYEAWSPE